MIGWVGDRVLVAVLDLHKAALLMLFSSESSILMVISVG